MKPKPSPRSIVLLGLALLTLTLRETGALADAAPGRYTVTTGAGATVTDNVTGLVWSRTEVGGTFTWSAAQSACVSPWRLPNIVELQSIVDETRSTAPTIDATAFWGPTASSVPTSGGAWSSSPTGLFAGDAWYVVFNGGWSGNGSGTLNHFGVRCVR
jgi:hypothetical protein